MPLADLLMERFKVKTRAVENPEAVTEASTTAQKVLANNPNRLGWTIVNNGDEDCAIGLTDALTMNNGVRLDANGGSAGEIWDEDFQEVGWAQWIIAESGTPAIYCKEVVEY